MSCNSKKFFTDVEVIDCPNLVEFLYRPFQYEKLSDNQIWSLPTLKKLKIHCSQKFIKSLKNLETLLISSFEQEDKCLLKELSKLKFLDVYDIHTELFAWIVKECGSRVRLSYRGLPAQCAMNRIKSREADSKYWFREDDLEIYRGQFEQVNDEIHFYLAFVIFDSSKQIDRRFFRKFVDVKCLDIVGDTLSQGELLDILGSFMNVESINFKNPNFEPDFYRKILPNACPHLRSFWLENKCKQLGYHF